jgi:hypothetical protein
MVVTYGDKVFRFEPYSSGLYYYDTRIAPTIQNSETTKTSCNITPYSLLQTVEENKEYFTADEIKGADNARKLQQEIGWPSIGAYKNIIKNNLVNNAEVTINNINRAELIYGPATPILQGRMTRQAPSTNKIEKVPLPLTITTHHTTKM